MVFRKEAVFYGTNGHPSDVFQVRADLFLVSILVASGRVAEGDVLDDGNAGFDPLAFLRLARCRA